MQDSNVTDEQLVLSLQKGDNTAFRILFERHYKVLLATSINIINDRNTAKDVVQDVFLKIWNKRETLNIKGPAIAYLKRAIINQSINKLGTSRRFVGEEVLKNNVSTETTATEQMEAKDLELVLNKTLNKLPERCRTVFVMKRLEGMRIKEIAETLNISPKTVENQLTKALKVLKKAMEPFVKENSF